jgi:integrase
VEILREMQAQRSGDFVFPGRRPGAPLPHTALLLKLRHMGIADATAHGMRSTFRDWAASSTNFSSEVAEMALAHVVGDETERAYRRTDLLEKRVQLAEAWAAFCSKPSIKDGARVVSIRGHVQ